MLRAMLADRFKLRMHTEMREESVLIMTAEKGGLKVPEVAAPVPPETPTDSSAMSDRGGGFGAKKMTMPRLASSVSLYVKQDVIDQTGLTGYYDFDLRWEAPRVEGMPPPDTAWARKASRCFSPRCAPSSACGSARARDRCSIG